MRIIAVIKSMDFRQLWSLFWLCVRYLRFVRPTLKATQRTVATCDELYGKKHHRNGKENAFRHALWNVLIVKESTDRNLPLSRAKAWAKIITDWHEDFSPNAPLARAMDLHNNQVGRDLASQFEAESVDFLIGHLLKMVPLSQKHDRIEALRNDRNTLVHIENSDD